MRAFYSLTALAIVMAAASGYLYWQTYRYALRSDAAVAVGVAGVKEDFRARVHPISTLSLEELRQSRVSKELADPKTALPQTYRFPYGEMIALSHYAEVCEPSRGLKIKTPELKKALLWHQFICGKSSTLPQTFFSDRPFIHPSGSSYVWLAAHSGKKEFSGPEWLKQHANVLHLQEALQEQSVGGLGIKLTGWELQNLLNGESIVLAHEFAFLASKRSSSYSPADKYDAYPRLEWEHFASTADFIASVQTDSPACLYRESNLCWLQNPTKNVLKTRTVATFLVAGFFILAASLTVSGYRRVQQRKHEAAQRLFTLQMLTHELRTPATSLRLSIETFRQEFDELPKESQKAFLRMCEELQRLDRVVEASKRYLNSEGTLALPDKTKITPMSANQFIAAALDGVEGSVKFVPLADDIQVRLDRYWVELCIKNLIDNAMAHGTPPVTVTLTEESGSLLISIEDRGSTSFSSLAEMSEPFRKDQNSKGLGLGLAIVRKVIQSMNGELGFRSSPTTFSLKLRDFA